MRARKCVAKAPPKFLSNHRMNSPHETEQRLNELEIKASFTDDLVEQLNLTVYRQQQQLDALLQEVIQLRQQSPEGGTASPRSPRDDLPPHY